MRTCVRVHVRVCVRVRVRMRVRVSLSVRVRVRVRVRVLLGVHILYVAKKSCTILSSHISQACVTFIKIFFEDCQQTGNAIIKSNVHYKLQNFNYLGLGLHDNVVNLGLGLGASFRLLCEPPWILVPS